LGIVERRRRERQERRQGILDAAERVFLQKGIAAATMDEIAQQAELSKGALYLYFKNKDELYLSLAVRALTELLDTLDAVRENSRTQRGLDRLRTLIRAYVAFARAHESRFRVAMSWLGSEYSVAGVGDTFSEYRALVARVFSHGVEAIETGKHDGSIRAELETAKTLVQLWAGTLGVLLLELNGAEVKRRMPARLDLPGLVDSFIDLALRGVQPEPVDEAAASGPRETGNRS
jgi:AcrR family transcriptional regulator